MIKRLIVIDRLRYTLTLKRPPTEGETRRDDGEYRWRKIRQYNIALGQIGYETPAGDFTVYGKSLAPSWKIPASPWVDEAWRDSYADADPPYVIPADDPANPIREAFIGVWDGVGIHGTANFASIGTASSHGCIRMLPDDVLDLYPRVPVRETLVHVPL